MFNVTHLRPNKAGNIRICCITDVHVGLNKGNKLGNLTPIYLQAFSRATNATLLTDDAVSAVVDLGDFSNGKDEDWEANAEQYGEAMGGLRPEIAFSALQGNHDTDFKGRIDVLKDVMSRPDLTHKPQILEAGPVSLLVYKTDIVDAAAKGNMSIPSEGIKEYRAFEERAAAKGQFTISMSHPGFGAPSKAFIDAKIHHHRDTEGYEFPLGKYYFENAKHIRDIQGEFGVHALDISGHRHKADLSGRFLTLPAFCWSPSHDKMHPCATFLDMRIKPDGISAQFLSVNIAGEVIPSRMPISDDIVQALDHISFERI